MDMTVTPHPALSDPRQRALIEVIQNGLPLVPRPYALVGGQVGMSEREVIRSLETLLEQGVIKRLGVVVRHRELGYDANAMVVWDVPDGEVGQVGRRLGGFPFVTLCYRRPRRLPEWPYNLFTMIHGRDRGQVLARVDELIQTCDLRAIPHAALFSGQRFKQRGARYSAPSGIASVACCRGETR
jgi:DNA-binding Lrp family transcriptional regulator